MGARIHVVRSLLVAVAFTVAIPCKTAAQLTCTGNPPCSNPGPVCGTARWPIKTGTDSGASFVSLIPVSNTIAALTSLPAAPGGSTRKPPTETTVYSINGTITGYKLEADSDYFLVVSDGLGNTMNVEVPNPKCATSSVWACFITTACNQLESKVTPTTTLQTANIPVQITGVGFFDAIQGETGQAPNGVEIHPVLDLKFSADFALTAIGRNLHFRLGKPFQLVVATFKDADPNPQLANFSATINWGDSTSSAGTITANGSGGFDVTGTHSYGKVGGWTVTIQINDAGGASAIATSHARLWPKPLSY